MSDQATLKVSIGSSNPCKIKSVETIMKKLFPDKQLVFSSFSVSSGVPDQPLSLRSIILGAKNRAERALNMEDCYDIGIGIESGLFKETGMDVEDGLLKKSDIWFEVTCTAIYDRKKYFTGLSPAWECPKTIMDKILECKVDMTRAYEMLEGVENSTLGQKDGMVAIFTNNEFTRQTYTEASITMAISSYMWRDPTNW